MSKRAIITGITGQDGSYLAELLLNKGYEVHGLVRRHSTAYETRIDRIKDKVNLHFNDITDASSLERIFRETKPDEVYHLAAQSHVGVSFEVPEYTANVTGVATIKLLEAIRNNSPQTKFYQASTSEMFGGLPETAPQSENTPFYPKSPYGAAKVYSYWITVNYRESYGTFTCNGILFNHESERRGVNFVTRKITLGLANILAGKQEKLYLGNMEAKRDWGFAGDYVKGMWLMLQQEKPDDYVLATNETHTVREFAQLAFRHAGIELEWQGKGIQEKGINKKTGEVLIEVSEEFYRPAEVEYLWGNPAKAEHILGWKRKVNFQELVERMVDYDMAKVNRLESNEFQKSALFV